MSDRWVIMENELRKTSVKLYSRQYEALEAIANKNGESVSEVVRKLIDQALSERVVEQNTDLMAKIIRQQLEVVLKTHVERLAAIESKKSHMAAASVFLNTQALMNLVPVERKKDAKQMYENARKKAVAYLKTKTDEFDMGM